MTDGNQALLLGLFATTISGIVIPVVSHILNARKFERQDAELAGQTKKLIKVKNNVIRIEKATNGMKSELVAVTALASRAEGKAEGRKEVTQEIAIAEKSL